MFSAIYGNSHSCCSANGHNKSVEAGLKILDLVISALALAAIFILPKYFNVQIPQMMQIGVGVAAGLLALIVLNKMIPGAESPRV